MIVCDFHDIQALKGGKIHDGSWMFYDMKGKEVCSAVEKKCRLKLEGKVTEGTG